MTSSLTVTISSTSSTATTVSTSELQANFLPEIMLDVDCDYVCALLDLIIINCKNLNEIKNLNSLHIDCDIISNSYINGVHSHRIHQFATSASHAKGETFVEIPKHLNYFPVNSKRLPSIRISIIDNEGKQVKISGEIICRINIKRADSKKVAA